MANEEIIGEVEKVRILLAEYSTLRAEIIARSGHGYQIVGFGFLGVSISNVSFDVSKPMSWIILISMIAAIGFGLWIFWREIQKESERIREIELDINFRAKEDLLVWENLWGGVATGLFGLGARLPRVCLIGKYAPIRTLSGRPFASDRNLN